MKPSIWGPQFWYILHTISFYYPENPSEYHKRAYHDFFHTLKDIIPCKDCQKHFTKHIQQYPITPHLDTRGALVRWVIQIHNFVNKSINDINKLYCSNNINCNYIKLMKKLFKNVQNNPNGSVNNYILIDSDNNFKLTHSWVEMFTLHDHDYIIGATFT